MNIFHKTIGLKLIFLSLYVSEIKFQKNLKFRVEIFPLDY